MWPFPKLDAANFISWATKLNDKAWNLWWFPLANQTVPIAVSIREETAARLCSWLHSSPVKSCNYIPGIFITMHLPCFGPDFLCSSCRQKCIFKIYFHTRGISLFLLTVNQFSLNTSATYCTQVLGEWMWMHRWYIIALLRWAVANSCIYTWMHMHIAGFITLSKWWPYVVQSNVTLP